MTSKKDAPEALDKIIAEQAAYYGMSVEEHGRMQRQMAEAQERAEREGWEERQKEASP